MHRNGCYVDHQVVRFYVTAFFKDVFDVGNGVVGAHHFVVIEASNAPNKAEGVEQGFVSGEDVDVGFRSET